MIAVVSEVRIALGPAAGETLMKMETYSSHNDPSARFTAYNLPDEAHPAE